MRAKQLRDLPHLLEAQLGGGAAAGLLVGLNLLLLVMQVPQHVSRVLLTPLVYPRVLRVNIRSFETQQLLHRGGRGGTVSRNHTQHKRNGETLMPPTVCTCLMTFSS